MAQGQDGNLSAGPTAGDSAAPERILTLSLESELRDSYLSYAMSVIISRALPDVRDGLKPSQRRILVAMNDLNLTPTAARAKCAKIVGETMGNYHPHGDQAIYPTLVRMAQEWNMRYVLVDKQGNFGSIAGLPPASMRYTEARMSPLAVEMLTDLDRGTVDMVPTYDGKRQEPTVLPSRLPNLLVNGADGIAVGMATSIPPHNLREVCDAVIALIERPHITVDELLQIIPGPDFPTGGVICGRQGIREGYHSGRGRIVIRARAHIAEEGPRTQIVISEIPFQQQRNRIMEAIGKAIQEEKITGIAGAPRDESSERRGEPVRIVLDLKRDADPQLVLNQLYRFTPLQDTFSIILLALVDGRPRILSLKQLLEEFIRHRSRVIRRRTEFLLREARRRAHILEGQLIALASLDEIIAIIRNAPSRAEAKQRLKDMAVSAAVLERALGAEGYATLVRELGLREAYRMTEEQAEAVVRMQLGQLAALERDTIVQEYNDLRTQIAQHEWLLADERRILDVIRTDMLELREKYGDDRRTQILDTSVEEMRYEDLLPEEATAVTLTHLGYIKRLPLHTYRAQHRGGKGVTGAATREDDFLEHFFVASTHDYLLFFTNRGQVHWLRVFDVPQLGRTSPGRAIANVLSLRPEETVSSVIAVRRFDPDRYLLMATRQGLVKKTALEAYSRPRSGGVIGIHLEPGDSLVGVVLVQEGDDVVLSTRSGMAIRFSQADVRPMGRDTRGVRGITLAPDDEVVGVVVADPQGYLLTVCEKGYGKRTPFGVCPPDEASEDGVDAAREEGSSEMSDGADALPAGDQSDESAAPAEPPSAMRYRRQRRGGKGIRDIRTEGRNGPVVATVSVRDGDQVMLVTQKGMVTRMRVDEIRVSGRNTLGVKLITLEADDRVVAAARVPRDEEQGAEQADAQAGSATDADADPPAPQ